IPNSATTLRAAGITRANAPPVKAIEKSHREALRCLKRHLSDAVYRRLVRDAHPDTATDLGGHAGATTKSSGPVWLVEPPRSSSRFTVHNTSGRLDFCPSRSAESGRFAPQRQRPNTMGRGEHPP
ncbi:MAG: hypothetical protein M3300_02180, partial [Actinomycetota bacterium]|nr:hypothetical protein [Actinomycetota bacterium]